MALTKRTYVDGETIITAQNLNDIQDEIIAHESNKVPITRTVNGKALSSNITLNATDVSAVPTSRTVNGNTLSNDVTINASDIPNDSTVSGEKVDDALDALNGAIAAITPFDNMPTLGSAKGVSSNGTAVQLDNLKTLINELTTYNILDFIQKTDSTASGITYTWNPDGSVTVSGTSTATDWNSIYQSTSSFPTGIVAGGTYRGYIGVSDNAPRLIVMAYAGSWTTLADITTASAEFTVPSNATGLALRINVPNGRTVNVTVKPVVAPITIDTDIAAQINKAIRDLGVATSLGYTDADAVSVDSVLFVSSSGGQPTISNVPVFPAWLISCGVGGVFTNFAMQILVPFYNYTRLAFRVKISGTWQEWNTRYKKIAMFGDSIVWGRDGSGSSTTRVSRPIPAIVGFDLGITADNYSVGSVGYITTQYVNKTAYTLLTETDLSGYDYVSLQFGINDSDSSLGTINDSKTASTIAGGLVKCIDYLHTNYPSITPIIFGPPLSTIYSGTYPDWSWNKTRVGGWTLAQLEELLKGIADKYFLPFISYKNSPLNSNTAQSLLPDGVHPTQAGYTILGQYVAGQIHNILG